MRQADRSRMETKRGRPVLLGLLLLTGLVVAITGCSSGGGSGGDGGVIGDPITASFTPSGTTQSPDRVRLTGSATSDLVML